MSEQPSDFVPDLDTTEFDELVRLGRAEIPRYAADWTDHNLHDPGITLVDLLAWIVDQQVFRIGFVSGRHRRAFAALLGQEPERPQPARGIVWPQVVLSEGRLAQQGALVVCVAQAALPFVLDRQLFLTGAALESAWVTVSGTRVPAPTSEFNAVSWTIDGYRHQGATALTLRFNGPLVPLAGGAPLSLGFDVVPHAGPAITPKDPAWGPVRYEYRDDAEGQWTQLPVEHDSTAGMATSGFVVVSVPEATVKTPWTELRISFDAGFFPVRPHIRAVTVNALPVVQIDQVNAATFAERGTGQPDQSIELFTGDLVAPLSRSDAKHLDIMVGGKTWFEVADFDSSGPDDLHYVLDGKRLVFGNGLNGRCPPLGVPIEHSFFARTAGAEGNLRPGLTWRIPALGGATGDYGVNRHALEGGRGESTAVELVAKARAAATRRQALVTNDDVTQAALGLSGMAVGRAEVLSRFDPRMPHRPVGGVRTLIVVPHGFTPETGAVPQAYVDSVAERLRHRRLVGERLVVQGPSIVRANVQIEVSTEPWADNSTVIVAVQAAVRNRLTALSVGHGEPWPLGRDLTVAEILYIAANVDGVATVPWVRIAASGAAMGEGPVAVPPDGVVVVGNGDVQVEALGRTSQFRTDRSTRGWE